MMNLFAIFLLSVVGVSTNAFVSTSNFRPSTFLFKNKQGAAAPTSDATAIFSPSHGRDTSLKLAAYNDDYDSALARNKARTDVRNFLTQRALQSFIHLLVETRDPHTVTWMEDFGGWSNLEEFHGTGALNLTIYPEWDTSLLKMMEEPPVVVVVRAKRRGKGHGGWSKNNPYMEVREK